MSGSLALESMHICVKYEGSMINNNGMRGNCRKNVSSFKNIGHTDLIYHVQKLG